MTNSGNNPRQAIVDMASALREVFKKYTRAVRRKAWKKLISNQGQKEIEKVLNQTSRPVSRFRTLPFAEWVSLQEFYLGTFPIPDYDTYIKIYRNPGYQEIKLLLPQMDYNEARGILLPNGVNYIWEGGDVPHQDVADLLHSYGETSTDAPNEIVNFFVIFQGGEPIVQGYEREKELLNHPSILKMLGREAA